MEVIHSVLQDNIKISGEVPAMEPRRGISDRSRRYPNSLICSSFWQYALELLIGEEVIIHFTGIKHPALGLTAASNSTPDNGRVNF